MCLNCYKKAHPIVTIPKPFYSNEYCCTACIDGIDFTTRYMFPQIGDGFKIIDEQIVYENLYHMECSECNVWPENGKSISKCSNCNQEFYNLSPKLNKRCIFCIWNHNKPLNKIIRRYYPIVVRKRIYISSHLLESNIMLFKLITKQKKQKKQKKQNKEEKVPFGWDPVMKKNNNKNNNNKNNNK